jgi:leucine efflux protein
VLLWLAVAGVAALLAAHPLVFKAVQYAGAAYLAWIGLKLVFARGGEASPIRMQPGHYARQAFLITLLNPKAIVFYMAFFPLFIDPATHRGLPTFAAMAPPSPDQRRLLPGPRVAGRCRQCPGARSPPPGRTLQRLAGVALVGFGLKLAAP